MSMCKTKEKFYKWLGMKLYNGSEQFKNIIYGIYYEDVHLPSLEKINNLIDENMELKLKINSIEQINTCTQASTESVNDQPEAKPKKKRKYTKRKKEVKE